MQFKNIPLEAMKFELVAGVPYLVAEWDAGTIRKHKRRAAFLITTKGTLEFDPCTTTAPQTIKEPRRFVKYWELHNKALNVKLTGNNLSEIVKQNSKLFDTKDVEWKGYACKALHNLYYLFREDNKKTKWKGWVPVRKEDVIPTI